MGTIVARKRKNGTTAYMAKIIIKRGGEVVHRQSETFERRAAAVSWIERREDELSKPGALDQIKADRPTLSDALDKLEKESANGINPVKTSAFKIIKTMEIERPSTGKAVMFSDIECQDVTSADIVELAKALAEDGTRGPSTVGNYLAHLSSVFTIARPAWQMPLDPQVMRDAQTVAKRLGLIEASKERDRRPSLDELDKLLAHFHDQQRRQPRAVKMSKVIPFAIFSTRRREEIAALQWDDLDEAHSRILVREMKNPGGTKGNDVWCDLTPEALAIIKSMPKVAGEIFPFEGGTIGKAFTEACKFLSIEDLVFHDLRHEGISRLFELGWGIPHVATVSGHKSWGSLKRYAHIRQRGDKYAGWKWLAEIMPLAIEPAGREDERASATSDN